MNIHESTPRVQPSFWRSRAGLALIVMSAVALYFLLEEHRAHLAGLFPYLIVLACPLMHLFMHHGHQHHGSSPRDDTARRDEP